MTSPLLFVSSNPSIDQYDDSPLVIDSDGTLVDYFNAGFPVSFPRIRLRDGQIRPAYVRFWASIRRRAAEIWNLPHKEIRPGLDFAITEIVHCKSRQENGVAEALATCKRLHWEDTLRLSSAKLIVVLGKVARDAFNLPPPGAAIRRHAAFQHRWIMTLPAPNARKIQKTVRAYHASEQLASVRGELEQARL